MLACVAAPAAAVPISAELTVDNIYGLYVGIPTTITLVGTNNQWQASEVYNFQAQTGDFVYVAAWDLGGPQAFQGVVNNGATAFPSNAASWVYTVISASSLPGWSAIDGPQPSLTALRSALASASWSTIGAVTSHGGAPWGPVVSDVATQWVWPDSLDNTSSSDGHLVVFRTATAVVSAVPEPSRAAMLLLGLAVAGLLAKRRLSS